MRLLPTALEMSRAVRVELWKLRRTGILLLGAAIPAAYVGLKLFGFALRGRKSLGSALYSYGYFVSIGQFFWEQLLVPLLAVAVCSWLIFLDRERGNWNALLSQPTPRSATYLAKFACAWFSTLFIQAGWWTAHAAAGILLRLEGQAALRGAGGRAAHVALAAGPVVAVQLWLSSRFESPFLAIGLGLVGNTAAVLFASSWLGCWHPWGLFSKASQAGAPYWLLGAAFAMAVAGAALGAWDFSRRDL